MEILFYITTVLTEHYLNRPEVWFGQFTDVLIGIYFIIKYDFQTGPKNRFA